MLKDIGMKRKTMVDFLKNFLKGRKFADRVYLRDDLMLQG
jgi:hypothetical protein